MKTKEIKKQNGFRLFLRDTAAVSPAIATLILIVIAAVAAAGVGILVTKTQDNANSQTANKDLSVSGTLKLAGASLLQETSLAEVSAVTKFYPAIKITVGAGTGNSGRAQLYNEQIDIAASGEVWPDTSGLKLPEPLTGLDYKGRELAVIQGGSPDATIYETKIGTGLVVPVVNSNNVLVFKITNTGPSSYDKTTKTLSINHSTLAAAYNGTAPIGDAPATVSATGKLTITAAPDTIVLTLVQRGDKASTHQKIISNWLYPGDPTTPTLDTNIANTTLTDIKKYNSVPDIRKYIKSTPNALGFLPYNPTASSFTGIVGAQLLSSGTTYVEPKNENKGIGGTYDAAAKSNYPAGKSLASDAYYYTQGVPSGATKAFLDFVTGADGQTILKENGWFSQ